MRFIFIWFFFLNLSNNRRLVGFCFIFLFFQIDLRSFLSFRHYLGNYFFLFRFLIFWWFLFFSSLSLFGLFCLGFAIFCFNNNFVIFFIFNFNWGFFHWILSWFFFCFCFKFSKIFMWIWTQTFHTFLSLFTSKLLTCCGHAKGFCDSLWSLWFWYFCNFLSFYCRFIGILLICWSFGCICNLWPSRIHTYNILRMSIDTKRNHFLIIVINRIIMFKEKITKDVISAINFVKWVFGNSKLTNSFSLM